VGGCRFPHREPADEGTGNTVNDLINANVPVGAFAPILSNVNGSGLAGNVLNREFCHNLSIFKFLYLLNLFFAEGSDVVIRGQGNTFNRLVGARIPVLASAPILSNINGGSSSSSSSGTPSSSSSSSSPSTSSGSSGSTSPGSSGSSGSSTSSSSRGDQ